MTKGLRVIPCMCNTLQTLRAPANGQNFETNEICAKKHQITTLSSLALLAGWQPSCTFGSG